MIDDLVADVLFVLARPALFLLVDGDTPEVENSIFTQRRSMSASCCRFPAGPRRLRAGGSTRPGRSKWSAMPSRNAACVR